MKFDTFVRSKALAEKILRCRNIVIVAALSLCAGITGSSAHADGVRQAHQVFRVSHASVSMTLVTAGSAGHSLGDLRVLPATTIFDADGFVVGRLDAQMVTTSIDYPSVGDEVRMSNLNFSFGVAPANAAGSPHTLLVAGSGRYATAYSTLPPGSFLVRSIIGGTGLFAGAQGYAESERLRDGTWTHTLHISGITARISTDTLRQ